MTRLFVWNAALCLLASCGESTTVDAPIKSELAASAISIEAEPAAAAPLEPEPLSAEQQAATNAQINLTALSAYRDFAESYKIETGAYPLTKRNFRSAIGAFEDAVEAGLPEGERAQLNLPEGAEMKTPGAIVYRSDGTDYKLMAQRTGDCSVVRQSHPEMIDAKRSYGPGDCIAYGYWTSGAENW